MPEAKVETNLKLISQLIPDLMLVIRPDGTILHTNTKPLRKYGFKKQDLLGKNILELDFIPADNKATIRENLARRLQGKKVAPYEVKLYTKSGEERHFEVNGSLAKYGEKTVDVALLRDITERKQAEEMRQSEERYRKLFELAPDGIVTLDIKGVVTSCSQAALKLSGYSEDEIVGKHFLKLPLIRVRDIPKYTRLLGSVVRGKLPKPFEITYYTKDGTPCWAEVNVSLLKVGDKRTAIIALRDFTERKRAEQERERLLGELEEKTKELEQIVYVTSHDLRSPLVNIQGFTKELEQALKRVHSVLHSGEVSSAVREKLAPILNEDIPDALQYILTSSSKIDSLLSGLLRLSRLGRAALSIKKLDMNKLVSDVIRAFEFHIKEAGVTLKVEELPPCLGDETQINQVFSNLLDNALKFLDPNRASIISISGRKEKGQVVYCVEDNGIGIAAEHQRKVFDIFHRDPSASGGEGLGLTIVQKILDRHAGKVWLESEPGKGSKFFVSLPAI